MSDSIASINVLLFALAMIGPIVPFAFWYRNRILQHASPDVRERILDATQNQSRNLSVAWVVALAVVMGWWLYERNAGAAVSKFLPFNVGVILLFHVTVWPFVMPLWNRVRSLAEDEGVFPSSQPGPLRSASLKPRRLSDYLPNYWRAVVGFTVLVGVFAVGFGLFTAGPIESRFRWMALAFAAIGVLELVVWRLVMRKETTGSGDYGGLSEEAAHSLRRFRIRGFFWLLVTTSVLFFAGGLGCIAVGAGIFAEPTLGVIGGITGSIVGLLGAVFGVVAGLKLTRLQAESARTNQPTQ